jgi:hypothetical protein
MFITRRSAALALTGLAAGISVLNSPAAQADPPNLPVAGSENARQTLNDITNAGYNPVLQYENGVPNSSLSQCTVTDIDGADASNGQGNVYVTVNCPK